MYVQPACRPLKSATLRAMKRVSGDAFEHRKPVAPGDPRQHDRSHPGYGRVVRTRVMLGVHERSRQITAIVETEENLAVNIARGQGAANPGTRLLVFQYEAPAGFQSEDGQRQMRNDITLA